MPKSTEQFVLVSGDPVDGFQFCGPFQTAEEANDHGDRDHKNDTWWVAPIHPEQEPK